MTGNWSKQIVEQNKVPVFLAGGLNAANIAKAIETAQPLGIDVCRGLEQMVILMKKN